MSASTIELGPITHYYLFFFFSSRRRHTRSTRDWSSDVCSSDLSRPLQVQPAPHHRLSQSVELSARPLPAAGHRRDGEHGPHQATLLRQPPPLEQIGRASCRERV